MRFYFAVGLLVWVWMALSIEPDDVGGEDQVNLARLLALPWCLLLWPVELYNDLFPARSPRGPSR